MRVGGGLAGRGEEGGPVDGVEAQDALADDVDPSVGLEPPAPVLRAVDGAEPEGADVVGEGVEPDVDHLGRITGHTDAPTPGAPHGPRDADVLQPPPHERQHLLPERPGVDGERFGPDEPLEVVLIGGQPEEPVLLGDPLEDGAVVGAPKLNRMIRSRVASFRGEDPVRHGGRSSAFAGRIMSVIELLAADAVVADVLPLVQVAVGGARQPQPLDGGTVARVRARADEVVEGQVERAR